MTLWNASLDDVFASPLLYDIACAYARHYTGDFDPLVAARVEIEEHGELAPRRARTVINCMLNDRDLPALLQHAANPHYEPFPGYREEHADEHDVVVAAHGPRCLVPEPPAKPRQVWMSMTPHNKIFIPQGRRRKAHLVTELSGILIQSLPPRLKCQSIYVAVAHGESYHLRDMSQLVADPPLEIQPCTRCFPPDGS